MVTGGHATDLFFEMTTDFRDFSFWLETMRGLRCKLRVMGIPIDGQAFVRGDRNTKKSNSVCCHRCREPAAMNERMTAGHVPTKQNPANLWAKGVPGGAQRDCLVTLTSCDITTT
jgi:hypothetical protein